MIDEQEKALRKVRALLKLRDGTTSENESMQAAAAASRLIAQHNFTELEIYRTPDRRVNQTTVSRRHKERWVKGIWYAVAQLNFCKYWSTEGLAQGIYHNLIGSQVNVTATITMSEYLVDTVWRLSLPIKGKDRNSFKLGASHRLWARLNELRHQRSTEGEKLPEATDTPEVGRTNLPALASLYKVHETENEQFFAVMGIKLHKGAKLRISSASAYHDGAQAANGIKLDKQVDHDDVAGLLK